MGNSSRLTLSWSRMTAYEACQHRVLRQMQGKSSPMTDGRNFLPGTMADRAMRSWLEEDDPQPGGMHKYVADLFDAHTGADAEYRIKWRGDPVSDKKAVLEQVYECLDNLEPILLEKILPYDYEPELRFTATIAVPNLSGTPVAIDLRGGIDLVRRNEAQKFGIYDLKNTRNEAYVRGKTLGQLCFYNIAFAAYMGIPAEDIEESGFIVPLVREKYVPVVITAEDRRIMMTRIVNYCHGVWRKEWKPTDDDNECYGCDVRHACDKFAVPNVKDAQGRRRVSFAQAAAMRRASGVTRKSRLRQEEVVDAPAEAGAVGGEEGHASGEAAGDQNEV